MMTLTQLKAALRPGSHGNALRGPAGWRPDKSGLWFGGWDCVIPAITTSPQEHFRGLAPQNPPRHALLLQTTPSGEEKGEEEEDQWKHS